MGKSAYHWQSDYEVKHLPTSFYDQVLLKWNIRLLSMVADFWPNSLKTIQKWVTQYAESEKSHEVIVEN